MAVVLALTSGKGGVGKTNIATNLGLALANKKQKVCLFDADTGLANINILLGISPRWTLEHVLEGSRAIQDILIDNLHGMSIVPAASGIESCTNLDSKKMAILTRALEYLEQQFDYIFVDTAAGIDESVLDFVASSQYRVVVVTPEPTSLTDAFALIKMLMARGKTQRIFILVNQAKDYKTSQIVFKRFQKAVQKYLDIELFYLGYLSVDEHISKAVTQQIPFFIAYPDAKISCEIKALADIIKNKFVNKKNLPFFSRYWSLNRGPAHIAQQEPTEYQTSALTRDREGHLDTVYRAITDQNLSESQFKELLLSLETVYEKKFNKPLKDPATLSALILADSHQENIKSFYTIFSENYQKTFQHSVTDPVTELQELLQSEQLNKPEFEKLLQEFSGIYKQRFEESFFPEANSLINTIHQLLNLKIKN
jgi:flagellar biosynthesis protein FlhG